jgi:hypothetical protein
MKKSMNLEKMGVAPLNEEQMESVVGGSFFHWLVTGIVTLIAEFLLSE